MFLIKFYVLQNSEYVLYESEYHGICMMQNKKKHSTIVKMKCRVRQMEIYGKSMRCKKQSTIAAVIGPCTCEMLEFESATHVHENTPLPIHTIVLGIRIFDTNTEKIAGEPFSTNDFSFNFTVKCSG